jgi:hypothetical protein
MPTNPTTNRIATVLNAPQLERINMLLNDLGRELSLFAVGLTTEERMVLPKMNDGNQPFVDDALAGARQTADLFPAYVKVDDLETDLHLFHQLDGLQQRLVRMVELVSDTQMLAGSEAYVTALSIYRLAEAAAQAGLPGADTLFRKLRQRFAGQGIAASTPPASA